MNAQNRKDWDKLNFIVSRTIAIVRCEIIKICTAILFHFRIQRIFSLTHTGIQSFILLQHIGFGHLIKKNYIKNVVLELFFDWQLAFKKRWSRLVLLDLHIPRAPYLAKAALASAIRYISVPKYWMTWNMFIGITNNTVVLRIFELSSKPNKVRLSKNPLRRFFFTSLYHKTNKKHAFHLYQFHYTQSFLLLYRMYRKKNKISRSLENLSAKFNLLPRFVLQITFPRAPQNGNKKKP